MDVKEALWYLMFKILPTANTSLTLPQAMEALKNSKLSDDAYEVLQKYYDNDYEKMRRDLDHLLTGMGEHFFDA